MQVSWKPIAFIRSRCTSKSCGSMKVEQLQRLPLTCLVLHHLFAALSEERRDFKRQSIDVTKILAPFLLTNNSVLRSLNWDSNAEMDFWAQFFEAVYMSFRILWQHMRKVIVPQSFVVTTIAMFPLKFVYDPILGWHLSCINCFIWNRSTPKLFLHCLSGYIFTLKNSTFHMRKTVTMCFNCRNKRTPKI